MSEFPSNIRHVAVLKLAVAMAPTVADMQMYWCSGIKWTDCTQPHCRCRSEALRLASLAFDNLKEYMVENGTCGPEKIV